MDIIFGIVYFLILCMYVFIYLLILERFSRPYYLFSSWLLVTEVAATTAAAAAVVVVVVVVVVEIGRAHV